MSEKPDPFVLLSVHYVVSCGNCPFVESYSTVDEARKEMSLHKNFCTHSHPATI